jgi:hypothetical protein
VLPISLLSFFSVEDHIARRLRLLAGPSVAVTFSAVTFSCVCGIITAGLLQSVFIHAPNKTIYAKKISNRFVFDNLWTEAQ